VAVWLMALSAITHADQLATYGAGGHDIALMTEPCGAKDGQIQRAVKRAKGRQLDGCWVVNARGNPVVMWSDGTVQELNESRVRLTPKYAAMLNDLDAPAVVEAERASTPDFPRPVWCKDAAFPHERLVCRDQELAEADLALSPLWRSFRMEMQLNEVQQGRVKSDYFRRLKACGTQKACIAREQAAQMRLYREALGRQSGLRGALRSEREPVHPRQPQESGRRASASARQHSPVLPDTPATARQSAR
jgi:hypothetical protein